MGERIYCYLSSIVGRLSLLFARDIVDPKSREWLEAEKYNNEHMRNVIICFKAKNAEELIADMVDRFGLNEVIRVARECYMRGGPIKRMWMDD